MPTTRTGLLPTLAAAVLLAGCGGATVGSGTTTTETRPVSGFTAVELAGGGTLTIEQTGSESLTVEAEDTILPLLTSEVRDGVLVLGTRPGSTVATRQPIRYRLTVDDLAGVTVAGSGDATATGLTTGSLQVAVHGSGSVRLTGNADSSDVEISGSGEYDGINLESATARVQVSGSGDAAVRASEALDVGISGSGTVAYSGDPAVSQNISGSGELVRR